MATLLDTTADKNWFSKLTFSDKQRIVDKFTEINNKVQSYQPTVPINTDGKSWDFIRTNSVAEQQFFRDYLSSIINGGQWLFALTPEQRQEVTDFITPAPYVMIIEDQAVIFHSNAPAPDSALKNLAKTGGNLTPQQIKHITWARDEARVNYRHGNNENPVRGYSGHSPQDRIKVRTDTNTINGDVDSANTAQGLLLNHTLGTVEILVDPEVLKPADYCSLPATSYDRYNHFNAITDDYTIRMDANEIGRAISLTPEFYEYQANKTKIEADYRDNLNAFFKRNTNPVSVINHQDQPCNDTSLTLVIDYDKRTVYLPPGLTDPATYCEKVGDTYDRKEHYAAIITYHDILTTANDIAQTISLTPQDESFKKQTRVIKNQYDDHLQAYFKIIHDEITTACKALKIAPNSPEYTSAFNQKKAGLIPDENQRRQFDNYCSQPPKKNGISALSNSQKKFTSNGYQAIQPVTLQKKWEELQTVELTQALTAEEINDALITKMANTSNYDVNQIQINKFRYISLLEYNSNKLSSEQCTALATFLLNSPDHLLKKERHTSNCFFKRDAYSNETRSMHQAIKCLLHDDISLTITGCLTHTLTIKLPVPAVGASVANSDNTNNKPITLSRFGH